MARSPQRSLPAVIGLEARRDFRCFNTDVSVQVADWRWAHLLPGVETFFHDFELRFSRFLPDSELSRFNRRTGPDMRVSEEMLDLLAECVRLYGLTSGVFNPLVLEGLEAAGYDASFERLRPGARKGPAQAAPSLDSLEVDAAAGTASLPVGLRLDFGGVGKGYAVDSASDLLVEAGGYLVDAGGDIYAAGSAPDGGTWRVDVADPADLDRRIDVVALSDQAVATSWTTRRRWQTSDGWAHHLIDPRSGAPAESGVIACTAVTQRAVDADVFAKCALILGPDEGLAFLESRGAHGLLVLADGSVLRTHGWPSA
jgi:thiamine biosynthesis lipoprotein